LFRDVEQGSQFKPINVQHSSTWKSTEVKHVHAHAHAVGDETNPNLGVLSTGKNTKFILLLKGKVTASVV
jgi:hypothetical protein